MGWNNQVVSNLTIITGGSGSGLFVYAGQPTKGNLILAISSNGGTDQYGNEYSAVLDVLSATTINTDGVFVYA